MGSNVLDICKRQYHQTQTHNNWVQTKIIHMKPLRMKSIIVHHPKIYIWETDPQVIWGSTGCMLSVQGMHVAMLSRKTTLI